MFVMLRTSFYLAILAILMVVRSSESASCISSSFDQSLSSSQLNAAGTNGIDYATSTVDQLLEKLLSEIEEGEASVNFTLRQTGDTINITFTLLYGCNDTITKTLADGTQKTTIVTSKVNPTDVETFVTTGL